MKYKRSENSLYIYADDIVPRHITCSLLMDYDTIAGGDKFGNLFMTRLPADTSTLVRDLAVQAPSDSRGCQRCRCTHRGAGVGWGMGSCAWAALQQSRSPLQLWHATAQATRPALHAIGGCRRRWRRTPRAASSALRGGR